MASSRLMLVFMGALGHHVAAFNASQCSLDSSKFSFAYSAKYLQYTDGGSSFETQDGMGGQCSVGSVWDYKSSSQVEVHVENSDHQSSSTHRSRAELRGKTFNMGDTSSAYLKIKVDNLDRNGLDEDRVILGQLFCEGGDNTYIELGWRDDVSDGPWFLLDNGGCDSYANGKLHGLGSGESIEMKIEQSGNNLKISSDKGKSYTTSVPGEDVYWKAGVYLQDEGKSSGSAKATFSEMAAKI